MSYHVTVWTERGKSRRIPVRMASDPIKIRIQYVLNTVLIVTAKETCSVCSTCSVAV
jgi:hypothetical protein